VLVLLNFSGKMIVEFLKFLDFPLMSEGGLLERIQVLHCFLQFSALLSMNSVQLSLFRKERKVRLSPKSECLGISAR